MRLVKARREPAFGTGKKKVSNENKSQRGSHYGVFKWF
jgi:hypothetical protein